MLIEGEVTAEKRIARLKIRREAGSYRVLDFDAEILNGIGD